MGFEPAESWSTSVEARKVRARKMIRELRGLGYRVELVAPLFDGLSDLDPGWSPQPDSEPLQRLSGRAVVVGSIGVDLAESSAPLPGTVPGLRGSFLVRRRRN